MCIEGLDKVSETEIKTNITNIINELTYVRGFDGFWDEVSSEDKELIKKQLFNISNRYFNRHKFEQRK